MKSESVSEAEEIEERAANTDEGDNWDLEMANLANYLNAGDRRSTIDVEDHSILAAVMSDEQTYNSMSALSEISSLMNSDRFWEELEVMNRESRDSSSGNVPSVSQISDAIAPEMIASTKESDEDKEQAQPHKKRK